MDYGILGERARMSDVPTAECELRLARLSSTGDKPAADELFERNLRLVFRMSRQWGSFLRARDGRAEDLVQAGCVGLWRAVQKFDPGRGVRFVTYAGHWIRAEMRYHVMRTLSLKRGGPEARYFSGVGSAMDALEKSGEDVTDEALADALEMTPDQLRITRSRLRDGAVELADSIGSHCDVEEHVAARMLVRDLVGARDEVASRFGDAYLQVLDHRVLCEDPVSGRELATILGVTRQRVSQVEIRLRRFLRGYLDR